MRWIAAGLVAAFALQTPPAQQDQRPTFRTEANYVRVDVYPTEDGRPVLDLKQDDFEVVEDGVPQKIDAFEQVVVRAAGPQETRHEPNTVAESRAALDNPRARVFVIFLDIGHVEVGGSHAIRKPLIDMLNRVIGPEDLVGVMTPEMAVTDITFARRTTTIEGMLTEHWNWGERDRISPTDPAEQRYLACYPGNGPTRKCPDDDRGVAAELIERHREKLTIDALDDLVRFLRGAREERKAVIAITDGWRLFRPNPGLERRLNCTLPTATSIGVDPRTGKISGRDPRDPRDPQAGDATLAMCDRDRLNLARIDDADEFRRILDEANRANTSFYPVDPRGLVVFDTQIVPPIHGTAEIPAMVPLTADAQLLRARLDSLRTLAESTDGIAVINNNDLDRGLKRIVDDLTSYYLLGYYTTGKLDGRFHAITVRVKRPGIQVRARRGYLAPTAAEAAAATAAARPATPAEAAAAAEKAIVTDALAPLGKFQRETPFNIRAAAGYKPGTTKSAVVWVTGEVAGSGTYAAQWREGATVQVMLKADDGSPNGMTVTTKEVKLEPGERTFRVALSPTEPLDAGDYVVRVTAHGAAAGAMPSTDLMRLSIPVAPESVGVLLARRGPGTLNRDLPTADLRFRRNEQVHIEIPTPDSQPVTGRLLDRNGRPIAIPVTTGVRDDPDGSRWATAQVALAPLTVGDYLVEITKTRSEDTKARSEDTKTRSERLLVAFRIVP